MYEASLDIKQVATAFVVPHGVDKTSPRTYIVLILFRILVLQEYWVLTESRIPLGE